MQLFWSQKKRSSFSIAPSQVAITTLGQARSTRTGPSKPVGSQGYGSKERAHHGNAVLEHPPGVETPALTGFIAPEDSEGSLATGTAEPDGARCPVFLAQPPPLSAVLKEPLNQHRTERFICNPNWEPVPATAGNQCQQQRPLTQRRCSAWAGREPGAGWKRQPRVPGRACENLPRSSEPPRPPQGLFPPPRIFETAASRLEFPQLPLKPGVGAARRDTNLTGLKSSSPRAAPALPTLDKAAPAPRTSVGRGSSHVRQTLKGERRLLDNAET